MSTARRKPARRSPPDVDLASKMSEEEDAVQVAEGLDDEIRAPDAAVKYAKYNLFKTADGVVRLLGDVGSEDVRGLDIVGCFVVGDEPPDRPIAEGGGIL